MRKPGDCSSQSTMGVSPRDLRKAKELAFAEGRPWHPPCSPSISASKVDLEHPAFWAGSRAAGQLLIKPTVNPEYLQHGIQVLIACKPCGK
jgi:hypothetical protein